MLLLKPQAGLDWAILAMASSVVKTSMKMLATVAAAASVWWSWTGSGVVVVNCRQLPISSIARYSRLSHTTESR